MADKKIGLTTYLTLSAIAAALVGILVFFGVGDEPWITALIWTGVTFIVSLVGIATLALSVKDDDSDPNQPRLR